MGYELNQVYNGLKKLAVIASLASYGFLSGCAKEQEVLCETQSQDLVQCVQENYCEPEGFLDSPEAALLAFQSHPSIDSIVQSELEDELRQGFDPEDLKRLHGVELEDYGFRPYADLSTDVEFYVVMEKGLADRVNDLELTIMLQKGYSGSPLEFDETISLKPNKLDEFEVDGDLRGFVINYKIPEVAEASDIIEAWTRGQYVLEISYDSECEDDGKAVLYLTNSQYWIEGIKTVTKPTSKPQEPQPTATPYPTHTQAPPGEREEGEPTEIPEIDPTITPPGPVPPTPKSPGRSGG